jgi:hypothetical protein
MQRIENISQNDSLSIAIDYGRISINNRWYRYDKDTDSLILTSKTPSPLLFDDEQESTNDSTEPF